MSNANPYQPNPYQPNPGQPNPPGSYGPYGAPGTPGPGMPQPSAMPGGPMPGGPGHPGYRSPYGAPGQPYGPAPRKRGGAGLAVGLTVGGAALLVVVLLCVFVFFGARNAMRSALENAGATQSQTGGGSGTGSSGSGGGSGSAGGLDYGYSDGGSHDTIINCNDAEEYIKYSDTVKGLYDKYNKQLVDGTIFADNNLPANQDSADYVHDFMIIITDHKAALNFGCVTNSTSMDEVNDQYAAKVNEVLEVERKFKAHEDFDVKIKITRKDGSVYESDGAAPEGTAADDLETKIKAVSVSKGSDGTYLAAGESLITAAGMVPNYNYDEIFTYCTRTTGDTSTIAASFCTASPNVVYINQTRSDFSLMVKDDSYVDIIKHELSHALINARCGTTRPAFGVEPEGLTNSYAVKFLGADKANTQKDIASFPEYAITAQTDQAADMVHNGQCKAS
ncbi:hypothetical protein [Bifidobacterium saguinibicoloris]|uniref:hypothetical protein n=1 Tax=Bifidobacterium saguinibicoloris TaxID=2834433 RepID=UPI001C57A86A|nr:hypothetical protein [Bifidobacterium saguinibicoloris]MBW3080637.1 hypothetical protein [Bifidobacterium saguinibicoloris]